MKRLIQKWLGIEEMVNDVTFAHRFVNSTDLRKEVKDALQTCLMSTDPDDPPDRRYYRTVNLVDTVKNSVEQWLNLQVQNDVREKIKYALEDNLISKEEFIDKVVHRILMKQLK